MLRTGSATRTKPPARRQLLETHAPVRARVPSSALLSSSCRSGIVQPTRYWIDLPFHPPGSPSQDSRAPVVVQPELHASSNSDTSRPPIEIRSTCRHLSADELHSGGPQHTPALVQLSRLFALTGSVSWPPSALHSNPAAGRLSNATNERATTTGLDLRDGSDLWQRCSRSFFSFLNHPLQPSFKRFNALQGTDSEWAARLI